MEFVFTDFGKSASWVGAGESLLLILGCVTFT